MAEVQVAFLTLKRKAARRYFKARSPSSNGFNLPKVVLLCYGVSTYMVGLFSRVDAQVALQRLQVTEACSTDLAWIWLLARVDQHMGTEMSNLKRDQKASSA